MTETHEEWFRRHMIEVAAPQMVNVAPQVMRDFWKAHFEALAIEAQRDGTVKQGPVEDESAGR